MHLKVKKILLVVNHFIPYVGSLGGAIRAITLADFFLTRGYDVTVVALKGQKFSDFGYSAVLNKLDVHYVDPQDATAKDWLNGNLRLLSAGIVPEARAKLFYRMFSVASSLMKEKGIRNVIVTTPPHNTQLVSLFLKQHFRGEVNLTVDYRDSWFTNLHYRKKKLLSRLSSERKEKEILRLADHFTYVSNPILEKIIDQYRLEKLREKSHLVMNGYNKALPRETAEAVSDGPIRVGYFGELSDSKTSYRNIENIVGALREKKELQEKIAFYFYGEIQLNNTSLEGVNNIHIESSVSHDEALKLMSTMDYLLIIHSNPDTSEEVITGKFFEYVSVRKPILNITPPNMEANRLVEKYGFGTIVNIATSESVRDGLMSLERVNGLYDGVDISVFSRDFQYQKFFECIE